jgi:peptidoglycan hydrolase-like protein with peptidoglycan-binding domain
MPDPAKDRPLVLGKGAPRPSGPGLSATEIVAAMLSLLWLAAVVVYFMLGEPEHVASGAGVGDSLLMKLFVVFLPIALIWVAAVTARTIRALRDEAQRLQVAVDAMRHSFVAQQQAAAAAITARPNVERKLDEIAAATRQTETALATFASSRRDTPAPRPPAAAAPAAQEQPALALEAPADDGRPPIAVDEFIRALNFPDNAEDKEGFRCLRLALEDREAARLIRAAQDVLTLLSQDGVYVDDLRPDRARPELWRRFAAGERGRTIAALGGIRDRSSIALTTGRMRTDPVFRDAAHHFLRQFDRSFQAFEKTATDEDIVELSNTRTARAFMLFGRVAGVFD